MKTFQDCSPYNALQWEPNGSSVMILPSCRLFSLVMRQDHDRIMFCV